MELSGIFVAVGVVLLIVVCWFGFYYLANPPMLSPEATARVVGNCGDTMEMSLRVVDDRVEKTRYSSDGCSISKQCIEAAAMLAQGKSIEEVRKINMMHVMEIVGELPDSHLHCAQLAETTLQHAMGDYIQKQRRMS